MMKLQSVKIRPVQKDDAKALNELSHALLKDKIGWVRTIDEWSPDFSAVSESIEKRDESGLNMSLVAIHDNHVIGDATIEVENLVRLKHVGVLGIGVHPNYQGQGIGKALTKYLLDWADKTGLIRVELGVFSSNKKAQKLYEQFGFVQEGVRKKFIRYEDGSFDDDILMARIKEFQ